MTDIYTTTLKQAIRTLEAKVAQLDQDLLLAEADAAYWKHQTDLRETLIDTILDLDDTDPPDLHPELDIVTTPTRQDWISEAIEHQNWRDN